MSTSMTESAAHTTGETLEARLARDPGALLERVAEEFGVSVLEAAAQLPAAHCTLVDGSAIGEILDTLTGWGDVMFIVHSAGFIVEVKAELPPARRARGYFNFHGDSALGGHLPEDACHRIALIDRPFMGRRSLSIQCFDAAGANVFKVFVGRDANRELLAHQVAAFEALRERYAATR
jgi:putative heme utilization carrier protein HutX